MRPKSRPTRPIARAVAAASTLAVVLGFSAAIAVAADEIRTQRVQFQKGASSATVKGRIVGYETIDYVLGAAKGQRMRVSMTTDNGASYFNLIAPGETDVAFFNGSTDENRYDGTLPATGDYKIRVYLMRSAARRNEKANHTLQVSITGAPQAAAKSRGDSVERAGMGRFDATGPIPCAQNRGQPMGQCPMGVARDGGGTATVVVTLPDGRKRVLFFEKGRASGSDASEADGAGAFRARTDTGLTMIQVGNERYEIPDSVVFGG